jgi:hypothetical protein
MARKHLGSMLRRVFKHSTTKSRGTRIAALLILAAVAHRSIQAHLLGSLAITQGSWLSHPGSTIDKVAE